MAKSARRIAILHSRKESSWLSCKFIVRNILAAYGGVFSGAVVRQFGLSDSYSEALSLAKEVRDFAPERIVFVDHLPHPVAFLTALDGLYGKKPLPALYFHIYGDFTFYCDRWVMLEPILKKCQVKFICASERQEALVLRLLLSQSSEATRVCPFPVDSGIYHFDPQLRSGWRTKLRIHPDETAIVYTGRLSLQKNVTELAHEIFEVWKMGVKPIRFFLAGAFDSIGAPFFGINIARGYYYHLWSSQLDRYPAAFRECIQYLGQYSENELAGLYNASDIFVSLSLHHDEDYGMSPAEALCCGNQALLTSWGGYASFADSRGDCKLVPTRIGRRGIELSSAAFRRNLAVKLFSKENETMRLERSRAFQNRFSIEAANKILAGIHSEKSDCSFEGFSWIMRRQTELKVRFADGAKQGTLYEEIYKYYAEKETKRI